MNAVRDYKVVWTSDGKNVLERGRLTLCMASGAEVHSDWSSSIVATGHGQHRRLPPVGQLIRVSFRDFKVESHKMSYEWDGNVARRGRVQLLEAI